MKFVVTAGPTREPIDPIRFLSNRSSGKMGYAIAEAALEAGHNVTLISGPVCIEPPRGAHLLRITTADQLFAAVQKEIVDCDVLVMCAAVADYKPVSFTEHKQEKHGGDFALVLTPTRDVLASLPKEHRNYFVVGFAAQTHQLESNAKKKLAAKNCDIMVANDVSRVDVGIDSDENEVVIFGKNGEEKRIPRAEKKSIARDLVKIISHMCELSLTKKT